MMQMSLKHGAMAVAALVVVVLLVFMCYKVKREGFTGMNTLLSDYGMIAAESPDQLSSEVGAVTVTPVVDVQTVAAGTAPGVHMNVHTKGASVVPTHSASLADQKAFLEQKSNQLTSEDLLPADDSLLDKNFLVNSFQLGVDSRGSMKNPNYQLRSDPIIQKNDNLTPFNQSVIEHQDTYRKQLEIGSV